MELMRHEGIVHLRIPDYCMFSCRVTSNEISHDPDSSWITKYTFGAIVEELPTDLFIVSGRAEIVMPTGFIRYDNVPCYIQVVRTFTDEIMYQTIGDSTPLVLPSPKQRIEIQFTIYADDLDRFEERKVKVPYNRFDILDLGED